MGNKENCKKYYQKNRQYFIDKARRWEKEHPIKTKQIRKRVMAKYFKTPKGKEAIKRCYDKGKSKWICRVETRRQQKKGKIYLIKKCKTCGSRKDLEIHHEVYSTKVKEIIQDASLGKIYYLCKKHHTFVI